MRHVLLRSMVGCLAVGLSACATTMTSGAYVERGFDLAAYRTYDWGPADALPTGDPRLDADPYFKDRFEGAVDKGLATRGLALAASGAPDLLLHYHASVSRRLDAKRLEAELESCVGENCPTGVVDYEAGTLILDIIDARTNRLLWRGWARDGIEDVLGDRDRLERMIDDAVARMLQRLPRGL
jgi:hypothetical protein